MVADERVLQLSLLRIFDLVEFYQVIVLRSLHHLTPLCTSFLSEPQVDITTIQYSMLSRLHQRSWVVDNH